MNEKTITIIKSSDNLEIESVKSILKDNNISMVVTNSNIDSMFGSNNVIFEKEIKVKESDYERAVLLLSESDSKNDVNEENVNDYFSKSELNNDYTKYEGYSFYYQKLFKEFDDNDGKFKNTWNWAAFFFVWIWYFVKGLWLYGFVILFVNVVLIVLLNHVSFILFLINVYCGLHGNYDMYSRYNKRIK